MFSEFIANTSYVSRFRNTSNTKLYKSIQKKSKETTWHWRQLVYNEVLPTPFRRIEVKNVVVEVEDGIIQAVYCPDETYNVHILDRDDIEAEYDTSVSQYYQDVEEICNELVDRTSI